MKNDDEAPPPRAVSDEDPTIRDPGPVAAPASKLEEAPTELFVPRRSPSQPAERPAREPINVEARSKGVSFSSPQPKRAAESKPPKNAAAAASGDAPPDGRSSNASAERRRLVRRTLKWARRVLVTLLLLSGLAMIAVALLIRHYSEGLPATSELKHYTPPQTTRILARDGTLLGEEFVERRTVVPLDTIPSHVKLAFLAAEDASFYEHPGLDYPGMLRAIWVNLRSHGSRQGASTITQQVVKNVLLTQERTYERKIKEVILARKIEQELSKDEILELYLNHIYFGHGRYGVEEASRYYFGKGVHDLTLGEAAVLAGVPKGPSRYSPREHLDAATGRRVYVLKQMVEKGFVKEELADEAKDEPVVLAPEPEQTSELAPEALAEVRRVLRDTLGEQALRGGYVVTTSIDPKLQAEARKALRDGLDAYDKRQKITAPLKKPKKMPLLYEGDPTKDDTAKVFMAEVTGGDDAKNELFVRVGTVRGRVSLSNTERYNPTKLPASKFAEPGTPVRVSFAPVQGKPKEEGALPSFKLELGPQAAIVAIDVRTREILALAGSYEGARAGFDRATQAQRQPGSSFKPFTYAVAIHDRKMTPATLLPTDPNVLKDDKYKPKNYDPNSAGEPKRARVGLAQSVNVSAAWLVKQVGADPVAQLARDLGIETTPLAEVRSNETKFTGESIALGAYEVKPRELANAYASLAAGGVYEQAHIVVKIVGPDGREVPIPRPESKRVLTDAEAYVVTDMMKSVVADGTGRGAKVLKRPIAGKTGTSNKARDAWFAGYSTDVACVAWTGFDDGAPLGAGESGGVTSLPIFVSFMRVAHQGKPATDFPVPAGITRATIDPKTGLLAKPEQEDALSEVFLAGTEPTETVKDEEPPVDASQEPSEASPPATDDGNLGPGLIAPPHEEVPKQDPPPESPDGSNHPG
ncbi:MAG: PBP1A family penicillin-binding protein [Polyangiaceae bacterium]|nr:PBP1A family penicillin-binding protein [Polyangiaceae bacterium]